MNVIRNKWFVLGSSSGGVTKWGEEITVEKEVKSEDVVFWIGYNKWRFFAQRCCEIMKKWVRFVKSSVDLFEKFCEKL